MLAPTGAPSHAPTPLLVCATVRARAATQPGRVDVLTRGLVLDAHATIFSVEMQTRLPLVTQPVAFASV